MIEDVRVDYFTITCSLSNAKPLWDKAKKAALDLEQTLQMRPWHFYGYNGFIYGNGSSGHFAYGEAKTDLQGVIVQASGDLAMRYVSGFFLDVTRWTRIDLAVTAELAQPEPTLCKGYYDWIVQNYGGPRQYSLIQNNKGGNTLYIGSRVSSEFGRVYDKGVELNNNEYAPGKLYRYEVELKRDKAKSAASSLMSHTLRQSNIVHPIAVTVYDWFCRKDIPPRFNRRDSEGLDLGMVASNRGGDKLQWLQKQVSPTVRDMLASGDRRVLDALGITDYYTLQSRQG